jgi:hypothetical protein
MQVDAPNAERAAKSAANENGPVLLSLPDESGILVLPLRAATVCELDQAERSAASRKSGSDLASNQTRKLAMT